LLEAGVICISHVLYSKPEYSRLLAGRLQRPRHRAGFFKNEQRELNSPDVTLRNAVDAIALDLPVHDQDLSSNISDKKNQTTYICLLMPFPLPRPSPATPRPSPSPSCVARLGVACCACDDCEEKRGPFGRGAPVKRGIPENCLGLSLGIVLNVNDVVVVSW
jgi:hypothetical protein